MVPMWHILQGYSKARDIIQLAKDLVEVAENKKIKFDPDKSGFVDEEKWSELHGGQPADQWDAGHVITEDGSHCIVFRNSAFEKLREKMDPLKFKIYVLETAMHEFLHILGYRDDSEIDKKTKDILREIMNVESS